MPRQNSLDRTRSTAIPMLASDWPMACASSTPVALSWRAVAVPMPGGWGQLASQLFHHSPQVVVMAFPQAVLSEHTSADAWRQKMLYPPPIRHWRTVALSVAKLPIVSQTIPGVHP